MLFLVGDSSMLTADVGLLELGTAGTGELISAKVSILRITATTASKGKVTKLKLHKDCRTCTLGFLNCSREYVVLAVSIARKSGCRVGGRRKQH